MKIAIVGPGKLGSGLGKLWAHKGHQVSVTLSRDRAKLDAIATEIGAQADTVNDAVAKSEVVVLTTKWAVVPEALAQAGTLQGKIVLDCSGSGLGRTGKAVLRVRAVAEGFLG